MPLRSVEAASRDDAIAAAREQFGPGARVVGVRRVRSGGVLGFFATERYVAEVDPEGGRPRTGEQPVVAPATAASGDPVAELAGLLGVDLTAGASASTQPALPTYSRASVARSAAAPAAAAAAAAVARTRVPAPRAEAAPSLAAVLSARSVRPEAAEPAAERTPAPARVRAGSVAPAPAPWTRSAAAVAVAERPPAPAQETTEDAAPPPPSPFTAALARMVAGDRDVRQAVEEALGEQAPRRAAGTPQQTGAVHQEEESVAVQDDDLSAGVAVEAAPVDDAVDGATWQAVPGPAPAPASPREEAIAEVLREALARGHSDEALASILRRVLDGASPEAALAVQPEPVVEPAVEEPAVEAEVEVILEQEAEPAVEEPVAEVAVEEPVAEPSPTRLLAVAVPAPADVEVAEVVVDEPVGDTALWSEPAFSMWGAPEPVVVPELEVVAEAEPEAPADPEPEPEVAEEPEAVEQAEAVEQPEAAEEPEAAGEQTTDEQTTDEIIDESAVEAPVQHAQQTATEVVRTSLARTASDPAPVSLDSTAVLPPIAAMPGMPSSGRRRGLPPVPPSARPKAPAARAATEPRSAARAAEPRPAEPAAPRPARVTPLATVVRLPVAPVFDAEDEESTAPLPAVPRRESATVARLRELGVPGRLLSGGFERAVEVDGLYAALTRALSGGLPAVPEVPSGAGEVLFVVGPGVETLRAARAMAASLRLDPDRVQWATRGELAGLAPKGSRMTTIDAAIDRRQEAAGAGTLTIVAVDAPLRTDTYWMSQMLAIWAPAAVWAVVDATRKPEDVGPWLRALPRLDALMVQDTDLSADPAAVLQRIDVPVALLDGAPATPHRWASLLCERLDPHLG